MKSGSENRLTPTITSGGYTVARASAAMPARRPHSWNATSPVSATTAVPTSAWATRPASAWCGSGW